MRVIETIWLLDVATGKATQLIDSDGATIQPAWSPDGRKLAFASDRSGNMDIWTLELATGQLSRLTDHPEFDADPTWSPGGREVAFVSTRGGELEIWSVPSRGGPARRSIRAGESGIRSMRDPFWMPAGIMR
jgi:TolB protein